MKTKTDKQKLEAIYDMSERVVNKIEFLHSISPNSLGKDYIAGKISAYNSLVEFLNDVRDGKDV